jgi:quercetin dioxygenase-like cupin family protein
MKFSWITRLRSYPALAIALVTFACLGSARATDVKPDPSALVYKLPAQIPWTGDPKGEQVAVLAGDPSTTGIYVELVRWAPHTMSHPHFHPNERYITVLSGTWWVGTGAKYDPDSTFPIPAGSFVKHFAKQVHYDGAKDEPTELEIVGEGPATSTHVDEK